MKFNLTFLSIAALAGSFHIAASAAEISGKVKLNGTPKPEIPIQMDATCGKLQPNQVTTRHFVVGEDKGLGNVFVYVKSTDLKAPPEGEAQMLDQVGCMYEPYVFGVVTAQKFKIRNSDALLHNVHALPKPGTGNKEFNFGQPVKGQVTEKQFDHPEVLLRVKCDVHPWMFAYIGVCTHPYFAVTDKDGNFKISGVPAGKYTIEAFHLKAGAKTSEVTLGADDKKALEFTLDAPTQ
jgi:hypothetical protein